MMEGMTTIQPNISHTSPPFTKTSSSTHVCPPHTVLFPPRLASIRFTVEGGVQSSEGWPATPPPPPPLTRPTSDLDPRPSKPRIGTLDHTMSFLFGRNRARPSTVDLPKQARDLVIKLDGPSGAAKVSGTERERGRAREKTYNTNPPYLTTVPTHPHDQQNCVYYPLRSRLHQPSPPV